MPRCSRWRIDSRAVSKEASVLPEPVGATMRRSEPFRIPAMAATCIELRWEMPALSSKSFWTASVGVPGLTADKACWNEMAPYKLHLGGMKIAEEPQA